MKKNKTQVVQASSVCEIDFVQLRKEGIDCILFDIEGTIAPWATADVPEEILDCIQKSGIKKRGIVTNISKHDAERVAEIADRIQAGAHHFPRSTIERKPGSYMIDKCIRELDTDQKSTIMVGDKLFDVLAAKRAGVAKVIWVEKLGREDHWFDTYIYRRVEPLLKKLLSTE